MKFQRPRLIHFLIALLLALLIVDRGAAYLYEPEPGSKDIVLYTTGWCTYCEALRAYLQGYSIPYIERDVEKSVSGLLGWWVLGRGRGVPLSVIGEQVVHGYDLDKINGALRALGYSIQGPGDTGSPEASYLVTGAAWGADLTAQQTAGGECVAAEDFAAFYEKFKADDGFRMQRTRFPLRKRALSGSSPYYTDEVSEITENQVLTQEEPVYLDQQALEVADYSERIHRNDENQVDITAGPEGSEPLTIHKFRKVSGCWYFVEFVSYEYFGSLMILH